MIIEVDSAICSLVECMLPRFGPEDLGLLVEIEPSYYSRTIKDDEGIKEVHRRLVFLFHRNSNYTKVFYLTQNNIGDCFFCSSLVEKRKKQFSGKWDLIGYHDSCWRDSLERKLREIQQEMMDEAGLDYPLKETDSRTTFDIFSPALCHVKLGRLPEESNSPTPYGRYSVEILGKIYEEERRSAIVYIASTCPLDELPLLINHEDKKVRKIVEQRIKNTKDTNGYCYKGKVPEELLS